MTSRQCFGKNVTLQADVIDIIEGYRNRTKQNFSATLNIIVIQWDKMSITLQKLEKEQQIKKDLEHLDQVAKAKVIK